MARFRFHLQPIDAALLLMTVIWGSNFTLVKLAVRDIPELPFNSLRLLIASAMFLLALAVREDAYTLTAAEWRRILELGIVGHFLYQLCFLGAVARTTVANNSLIFAFTPITVSLLTAARGHERIPASRWIGALISLAGIYLVVGADGGADGASRLGDLLSVGAMLCWTIYTVGARFLLATRSPLLVTGYSMTIGGILYLPVAWRGLGALAWTEVRPGAWAALLASALLALFVAYVIWYTAVQKLGGSRTAVYSNVTPLVAMAVAAIWLGEPLTLPKLAGAAAVILGLAVTKLERRMVPPPLEA
jgi:drug/metabolite transporter (DMT)-like permease